MNTQEEGQEDDDLDNILAKKTIKKKKNKRCLDDYERSIDLGEGAYGQVFLANDKLTG